MRRNGVESAMYRKIAIDIAKGIADGKYVMGQRLFGRSVLSSKYNVSPETIRKAVYILKDVGVLDTEKGSGIEVVSIEKAREFIERNKETETLKEVRREIAEWADNQKKESEKIAKLLQTVTSVAKQGQSDNPFVPFEIVVTPASKVLGKTISEAMIWQNTGSTVIAINHEGKIVLSPGPYFSFNAGDVVFVIGSEQAFAVAKELIE